MGNFIEIQQFILNKFQIIPSIAFVMLAKVHSLDSCLAQNIRLGSGTTPA